MLKNEYRVVGVMSGTSLDGIDLVYASFTKSSGWDFDIVYAETQPYNKAWLDVLQHLVGRSKSDLEKINEEYTVYLAGVIQEFITKHNIKSIDAVCSHGHTALHDPENGLTLQIGNLPQLATLINETVVCDFRVDDVALGGQGAPLVPIGDALLFSDYNYCLNLGGFANVSTELYGKRVAFDICPVNIVLNHYVKPLGVSFDRDGKLAQKGQIQQELLEQLNALEFYGETYPKSLGLEWVMGHVFPLIDTFNLETADVLRTVVEHVAVQISKVVPHTKATTMLVTGGGAYNKFLIERIKALSGCTVEIPDANIVEFKEALIFGLLGILRLRGEVNCLMSVTGARKDHSSGYVYRPKNN
ncbi:anhydro-N-acetylmuramic acid kinase [Formosa sp. S-31]|uniref:anhydro-N-acetylmuramic acid kinase n=1 Tax=Formosa sp. S-31 TaxID=2790949 RepID=UPI003EBAA204